MNDIRDTRDPLALGEILLSLPRKPGEPLSSIADLEKHFAIKSYNTNPTPLEKYGDPRQLPSTLPN